ncbi:tryptophan synthase subunit alpha [compost metagenome]
MAARVKHVRGFAKLPVGVGFGIRDARSARAVGAVADAVVIGSALIEEIEKTPRDRVTTQVTRFLAPIREALDNISTVKA